MKNLFVFKLANTLSEACGVCDLYGNVGRCNRKLVNPKKQLACSGNTYYEYMPLRKLKKRRF